MPDQNRTEHIMQGKGNKDQLGRSALGRYGRITRNSSFIPTGVPMPMNVLVTATGLSVTQI